MHTTPDTGERRRRSTEQFLIEVVRTDRVTPHLQRIVFGGAGVADLLAKADPEKLAKTDKYTKLLFAKPELGLVPPYDMDALRETLAPEDMPSRRTYTVLDADVQAGIVAIEFVIHGDEGIAGPWAAGAQPGDRIAAGGIGGGYAPSGGEVEYLYAGDESSLPAIEAAIAALPSTARGRVLVEVGSAVDETPVRVPAGVELRWIHRGDARHGEPLVDAIRALPVPEGAVEVFAHGEREAMKALRPVFVGEWGIERRALSLSAYWAYGRAEDTFQAEKREAIGKIFDD